MIELKCGKRTLPLNTPQVMGILNVTPDSFSDGGQLYSHSMLSIDKALFRAAEMKAQGATLLDIGGESTRPGSDIVTVQEEMDRVLPVLERVSQEIDIIISVDTSTPELMKEAAALGAGMINDVRALSRPGALEVAADTGLAVCLMHMQGEPKTMQQHPSYENVVDEVVQFLCAAAERCVGAGIDPTLIVLDPGFGFGKRLEDNLILLQQLHRLVDLGYPVLSATSRKTMIGLLCDRPVDQRMAGSVATAMLAVQAGAKIVRVHDVSETVDVLKILAATNRRLHKGN